MMILYILLLFLIFMARLHPSLSKHSILRIEEVVKGAIYHVTNGHTKDFIEKSRLSFRVCVKNNQIVAFLHYMVICTFFKTDYKIKG